MWGNLGAHSGLSDSALGMGPNAVTVRGRGRRWEPPAAQAVPDTVLGPCAPTATQRALPLHLPHWLSAESRRVWL